MLRDAPGRHFKLKSPVLDVQSGDLCEVLPVAREEGPAMGQGDGRDAKVHRRHAQLALEEGCVFVRGGGVEVQKRHPSVVFEELAEPGVGAVTGVV